jgi:hypothetical protein
MKEAKFVLESIRAKYNKELQVQFHPYPEFMHVSKHYEPRFDGQLLLKMLEQNKKCWQRTPGI